MVRLAFVTTLSLTLVSCGPHVFDREIFKEDSKDRYLVVYESGPGSGVGVGGSSIPHRPELAGPVEKEGDVEWICSTMPDWGSPRIVVESRNPRRYRVIYQMWDPGAPALIADAIGVTATREEREILAITIREAEGGHRLKPAAEGKRIEIDRVCCNQDGTWPLDGVTGDELAAFLERRYRRPVVNLMSLEGRWSFLVSARSGKMWPQSATEVARFDETGLELRWEKVKVPVTVVKDK